MSALKKTRGLGKGLSALMSDSYSQTKPEASSNIVEVVNEGPAQQIALHKIHSGKYQPREFFNEPALADLANSIRRNGVIQPIIVRKDGNDRYEIIAGERRWRAAKIAGLDEIPVVVRDIPSEHVLELAIVENVQREDLHPLEEAGGYQRLLDEFGYTQEDVAAAVNKSRSHIANLLRLLGLPKEVQQLFSEDRLSMGHARALVGVDNAWEIADEVVRKNLNVRQTEKLVSQGKTPNKPREPKAAKVQEIHAPQNAAPQYPYMPQVHKDQDILALEETLSENLGLKVGINDRGQSGEITIAYETLEQLDDILRRLGGSI